MLLVLGLVHRLGLIEPALDLCSQTRLLLAHPLVAHGRVLARVGLELAPIQRNVPEPDQARATAQPQHLNEQLAQRLEMALAEQIHRAKVRLLHRRHRHEVHPLLAGLRDPPRRVDALRVRVEQQRRHHHWVKRRLTALFGVAVQDRAEVEIVAHQLAHEVRRVIDGHQLPYRGW